MKVLITLSIILFASTFAYSQTECPQGFVCITPEAAKAALVAGDTVKAQAVELAAKDKAIADLKDELNKMRVEYAEARGELTALRQNSVSDRAIITAMIPMLRQKVVGIKIF